MQILVRWDCQVASMASVATEYIPSENLKTIIKLSPSLVAAVACWILRPPWDMLILMWHWYGETVKWLLSISGVGHLWQQNVYPRKIWKKNVQIVTKSCGSCGMLKFETPLWYANTDMVRLWSGCWVAVVLGSKTEFLSEAFLAQILFVAWLSLFQKKSLGNFFS